MFSLIINCKKRINPYEGPKYIRISNVRTYRCRELDPAILRRFEKRIFVDLPDVQARKDMFVYYLSDMLQKNKYIKCEIDSDGLAQVNFVKTKHP